MNETNETAIRLSGLSKSYSEGDLEHRVLIDVDVTVLRGTSIAIRGRSGSGKSTLLNLVGGIDTPDSGSVEVNGTPLTGLDEKRRTLFRRENIGFVYQAFNLIPTLTVGDNVRLVLELNKTRGRAADARIDALLAAVGLLDRRDSFPDVLSGGEQQRVALARALAHEPGVVLADEPTGNLDDDAAGKVLELLDRLVRQQGGTMMIATHSERVAAFCDKTLYLHSGHLGEAP